MERNAPDLHCRLSRVGTVGHSSAEKSQKQRLIAHCYGWSAVGLVGINQNVAQTGSQDRRSRTLGWAPERSEAVTQPVRHKAVYAQVLGQNSETATNA